MSLGANVMFRNYQIFYYCMLLVIRLLVLAFDCGILHQKDEINTDEFVLNDKNGVRDNS